MSPPGAAIRSTIETSAVPAMLTLGINHDRVEDDRVEDGLASLREGRQLLLRAALGPPRWLSCS